MDKVLDAPLYTALKDYAQKNTYPFHMPGHKQNKIFGEMLLDINMDITEIENFDNLHDAKGIINDAQKKAAQTFGADKTIFLINGSTVGIVAAIYAHSTENDYILVARNCHKSVYSGIILSGSHPVYVYPEITEYGTAGGIDPNDVLQKLYENKNIKVCIITSPTYEGFTSDIQQIADICHANNCILIVDEAHGSHFNFNICFPKSAVLSGADIVIHSLHKTLPSLTQTALLHISRINSGLVKTDRLLEALQMLETSSPSYILMASIDLCRALIDDSVYLFEAYVQSLQEFRCNMAKQKSVTLIGREIENTSAITQIDIGKLTFVSHNIPAIYANDILYSKFNLRLEAYYINHFIAMTSVFDTTDALHKLKSAIEYLETEPYSMSNLFGNKYIQPEAIVLLKPKEASQMPYYKVDLSKSSGLVSAQFVTPYPPGIPLLSPGEIITSELIQLINIISQYDIQILGLSNELKIKVITQIK